MSSSAHTYIRIFAGIKLLEAGLFMHQSGKVALVFALLDRLAFVVFFLTACDTDYKLGITTVADEKTQRHNGVSESLLIFPIFAISFL